MGGIDRSYYSVWKRLKASGTVSLTANRLLHPRIIKAITKEKWMDHAFRIQIEPRVAFLSSSRNFSILTFTLEIRDGKWMDGRRFNNSPMRKKLFEGNL